jgi:HSP90 family molecular chaperone
MSLVAWKAASTASVSLTPSLLLNYSVPPVSSSLQVFLRELVSNASDALDKIRFIR